MKMHAWMVPTAALTVLAPLLGAQTPAVQRASSCGAGIPYVELSAHDTVGVSVNRVTDSTFDSRVRAVAQGAYVHFSGMRDSDGAVRKLHIEIWRAIADSSGPPSQLANLSVQQHEIVSTVAASTRGVQVQRDSIVPGTMLFMDNEPIFLELLQRQVHPALNDSLRVRWLWLFTGGATEEVTVRRTAPDVIMIDSPQLQFLLRIAKDGSIASATSKPRAGRTGGPMTLTRSECR